MLVIDKSIWTRDLPKKDTRSGSYSNSINLFLTHIRISRTKLNCIYLASNSSKLAQAGSWFLLKIDHTEVKRCLYKLLAFVHRTLNIIFSLYMHVVSNRPEPVLWTKDGAELPDPDRMVVSGRELNILFLNKTDNGTYRCEATNTIGQSSAEYVLIVHGEFFGKHYIR